MQTGKDMMAESKFFMGYSRWMEGENRYESWDESVSRVMDMHREKYSEVMTPELEELISFSEQMYKEKKVLGAQRALQFGGEQIFKHVARMYNCSVTNMDRARAFQETFYMLLCGSGVGFSVQKQHVAELPQVQRRHERKSRVFIVPDSIEGWADAIGVLLSSYFVGGGTFPDYEKHKVLFDYSKIRPKGAEISGGFKAPGPDGLRQALQNVETLLDAYIGETKEPKDISPITVYDIVMFISDAVLSGGVRRSATICMFSKDDEEMLNAKTGDWFHTHPHRARSNNSVMLIRDELTREEWAHIMKSVKEVGEPGFIFTEDLDFLFNPCVEIGMRPYHETTKESGFQMCNLTEISGAQCNDLTSFLASCKAASIIGTLQAGYTDFTYLTDVSKEIVEREALIGVSITGWMNNPEVLFNKENMIKGAEEVKKWNKVTADLIGIKQAARTTCVKPSGNASVLLGTASGIHGEHSPRYLRHVQMNEQDDALHAIQDANPKMVSPSIWSNTGTDFAVAFPIETQEGSIYKKDLMGVKQLEYVKLAQQYWVEYGTNLGLCVDQRLRHNVSNTITVDDWDEVEQYIFDNREWFAGISLLSAMGDRAYPQAPFTEVYTADQILEMYGTASMFASGLIVDGLAAFGSLWTASDTVNGWGLELDPECKTDLLKRDWVRRAKKFAKNYFEGDLLEMSNCLKDCFNLHRWESIQTHFKSIDFTEELNERQFVEVDTMGAQACAGGACEI